MLKKNNPSPQPIKAKVVNATTGAAITTGVVAYHITGSTRTSVAGTAAAHIANGFWTYTPTQAETNYAEYAIEFYHADALAGGPVVQVFTDTKLVSELNDFNNDTETVDLYAGANTWFVRKTGNDSNAGHSELTAKLTVAAAASAVANGDTIDIGPGAFNEAVDLSGKTGIRIRGAGLGTKIYTNAAAALKIGHYTTVEDLWASSTSTAGIGDPGIHFNGKIGCVLRNVRADGIYDGVYAGPCEDLLVENCTIKGTYDGLNLNAAIRYRLVNSLIVTDSSYPPDQNTRALIADGGTGESIGCVFYTTRTANTNATTSAVDVSGVHQFTDCLFFVSSTHASGTGEVNGVFVSGTTSKVTVKGGQVVVTNAGSGATNDLKQTSGVLSVSGLVYDPTKTSGTITQTAGIASLSTAVAALPNAGAIADAVLDEAMSGHVGTGSLGKSIADIGSYVDCLPETWVTVPTAVQVRQEMDSNSTKLAGAALEATLSAMKGTGFSSTTDSLEALRDRGDAAWITATGFSTHSPSDVASAILAAPANKLATDGSGRVTAGTVADKSGYSLETAPPTTSQIVAAMQNTGTVLAKLESTMELHSGAYRFTESALAEAPSGSFEGATAEAIREEIDANSTKLAAILEDTGTELPAAIAEIEAGSGASPAEIWNYAVEHDLLPDNFGAMAISTLGYVIVCDAAGALVSYLPSRGAYCSRTHVEDVFGAANVAKWADLDDDGDLAKIAARIERAIEWAAAELDDRLRGGPYTVPLSAVPATIVNLAAQLAGVWLYESRGVQDFDAETGRSNHRLAWHRQNVERTVKEIRGGQRRLGISGDTMSITAPFTA